MSIREIRIDSLGDLLDRVTPAEPDERTKRRRDTGVYRGSGTADKRLFTSLDRLSGRDTPFEKNDLEAHILRNFIRYARPYFTVEPPNDWEYLVTAQHHGVPTRLLDWSYSPLVAVFFATRREEETDRVVWRLDWQRLHRAFKLPELALLSADLDHLTGDDGHFTPWMLMRGQKKSAVREFACLLEPPTIDARIAAQAAVFTLCTDKTRSLDEFLAEHDLEDALTRYVIPGNRVGYFRDQLDLAAIDERRLFPDLDGVAAALRRYYA